MTGQQQQPALRGPIAQPLLAGGQGVVHNAIIVSKRQQGNPVLKHIRNVRWQFDDIVPDYQVGRVAPIYLPFFTCLPFFTFHSALYRA